MSCIAILGTVLVLAAALRASADRDWNYYDFEKKVRKLAVYRENAAKLLCVCRDGGSRHSHAGWLESNRITVPPDGNWVLQVRCLVPTFEPRPPYDRDNYGFFLDFEVLNK
jgi:hypothetical protein